MYEWSRLVLILLLIALKVVRVLQANRVRVVTIGFDLTSDWTKSGTRSLSQSCASGNMIGFDFTSDWT